MLTTTHAIWSYIIFRNLSRSKIETFAIVLASTLPDMEILFWTGMGLFDKLFKLNPLGIDYNDLLYGSGISFWYWSLTLITNSILTTAVIAIALSLLLKNTKIYITCWLVVLFHILLDAFTHKAGNMLFWPLSIKKYLGLFEFNALPIKIILFEQFFSFGVLFLFISYKNKMKRVLVER
ncbi:MAG: metal-dependent hydrolase [Planctomycetia bacterium]|nr:metal-dependent hydrolase [Planctomycetia bacterium]